MILVEPSAALAILKEEADASIYRDRLALAHPRVMTVVGQIEATISLGRTLQNHDLAKMIISQFCEAAEISIVPIEPNMFSEVVTAYRRYGKGTGHPAQLNFGDCLSYAYCKSHEIPLLYKGEDFSKTDLQSAL